MARSEEAILRRALKRDRTEGQQRQADRIDMNRQALKLKEKARTGSDSNKRPRVSNAPSSDRKRNGYRQDRGNVDRGSRRAPSKMGGRNPGAPPKTNGVKKPRHNEETSKKLIWARQADSEKISKNQELRQRYRETGGEGMDAEDLERAKLLIARDQRKKDKKKKTKSCPTETNAKVTQTSSDTMKEENNASTPKNEASAPEEAAQQSATDASKTTKRRKSSGDQAKRDQNNALRLLYLKTNGKGMKEDQIERAKLLIARDEKKRKRRAEKEAGKKQ